MSRLLDALRNLQQPEEASDDAPPRKVTPRLSASIRKAVMGDAASPRATQPATPEVLFQVPATETIPIDAVRPAAIRPTAVQPAAVQLETVQPEIVQPEIVQPAASPVSPPPDPVRLVEAIQASISSLHEPPPAPTSEPVAAPSVAQPPSPVPPARPQPTAAEVELRGLLASEAHSRPYRDLLAIVQRDVAAQATPVIAIVGLEGQDSTAHVAAALGALLADELLADEQTKPILLLEANPAGSLAKRYGLSHASGLAELLAGRIERSKAVALTSHQQLELLPFGLATEEQARLLPAALSAELAHSRTTHAAAVVDAGPLSSAWALAACQAADAAYLVVRVGDTSAEHATSCVQRFRAAGGKLTGCIAVGPIG